MKVKGLDALVRKLRMMPENIKKDMKDDIRDAADMIVIDSANAAPVDLGFLKNSISNYPKNKGLNYVVRVGANYAPYIEFGTGTEVQVPSELSDYAIQFKGEGKRDINIPARPFFFPAYFKHRNELIKNLRETVKRNLNK